MSSIALGPTRVLLTGHSRGLGRALTQVLCQQGVAVLGLSRHPCAPPSGIPWRTLQEVALDLSDAQALQAWLSRDELHDFLHGATRVALINNAGTVHPMGPAGTQGAVAIANAVHLNLTSALMLTDAWVACSHAVPDRRVVHLGSGAGRAPYPGWSVYGATKAALDLHARACQLEPQPGLRVASVAPGVIDTDMQADIRATPTDRFPRRERFDALQQQGLLTSPERAAHALLDHLWSDAFGQDPTPDLRQLSAQG